MPFAPQTINIRYGQPSSLLALAGQTGSAENRMSNYQNEYTGYLRKLSMDNDFLNQEANRRLNDSHFTQQLAQHQSEEATQNDQFQQEVGLKDAYQQSLLALKQKEIDTRQSAQKSAAARTPAAAKPLDLVNADGTPFVPAEKKGVGIIQNTDTGEVTQDVGGKVSQFNADGNVLEGPSAMERIAELEAQANPPGTGGAPMTRQQFMQNQRIDAARGNLEFREQNVNQRQQNSIANRAAPMTIAQRDAAHRESDATALQGVLDSADPGQITNTANSDLWRQGAMMFSPKNPKHVEAATQMLSNQIARLRTEAAALSKPVTNSNGSTPSGGNPVPVHGMTPDQVAKSLPSGTIIQLPDGTLGRVP